MLFPDVVVFCSLSLSLWKTLTPVTLHFFFLSLPLSRHTQQCLSTVEIIRASPTLNQILPPEHIMTTKECAQILSVLNTNAHMLEAGGSALFPEAGAMYVCD